MGCTASKLDNEDTVRRCKERRRLMKAAVCSRHHLAAAHSDYCRSLRLTGSALDSFAAGEPLSVSDHTPAVLLRNPSSVSTSTTTTTTTIKPPRPPPPQRHIPSPQPAFSPTIASSNLPHILSSSSHQRRKKKPIKLPHILSDSSFTSSPKPATAHRDFNDDDNTFFTYNAKANSSYANTPSQTSSVWNWENFYPPSPPDSEFFEQLKNKQNPSKNNHRSDVDDDEEEDEKGSRYSARSKYSQREIHQQQQQNNKRYDFFDDDKASSYSSYSSYSRNDRVNENVFGRKNGVGNSQHHLNRWDSEEDDEETERETEREEVQCSEWGDHDHYSTTSSSSGDDEAGERESRSGVGTKPNVQANNNPTAAPNAGGKMGIDPSSNVKLGSTAAAAAKFSEKFSTSDGSSTVSWGNNNEKGDREMVADRRIVVRHKDLAEIVSAIKEYFDKAATAGEQVSEMLETGRAQLDRSFSKLKSKCLFLFGPEQSEIFFKKIV